MMVVFEMTYRPPVKTSMQSDIIILTLHRLKKCRPEHWRNLHLVYGQSPKCHLTLDLGHTSVF